VLVIAASHQEQEALELCISSKQFLWKSHRGVALFCWYLIITSSMLMITGRMWNRGGGCSSEKKTLKLKSFSKESKWSGWFLCYDICEYNFLFLYEICEIISDGRTCVTLWWDWTETCEHLGITTGYRLDDRGGCWSSNPNRGGIFLLSTSFRPVLVSTQRPIQWVPGALSPWVRRQEHEANHSPPTSAVDKYTLIYNSTLPYVFMV
jgi:hypothetical protein